MPITMAEVGQAVKEMRTDMGWDVNTLAQKAGVSHGTICNVEKGGNATLDVLFKIAQAFNIKPCLLVMSAVDRITLSSRFNTRW